MKFRIVHEIKGRMRVHVHQKNMSFKEADILEYFLLKQQGITKVKVYERNQDIAIWYDTDRNAVVSLLQKFSYDTVSVPDSAWQNSGREVNREYWDKLVTKVVMRMGSKLFIPFSIRRIVITCKSAKYIVNGLRCLAKGKIEVPVLDGTAIAVSIFRGDFKTAGSVMFLLGIGELLEDWTHKKSVDDLARSMSLNVGKVWLLTEDK